MGRVSTPEPVRIGHHEREAAVKTLGEHFGEGRLEPEEYEERVSVAYAARTADDLEPLFRDLPRTPGAPGATAFVQSYPEPGLPQPLYQPAYPALPGTRDLDAPYGREPATGIPYSDCNRTVAGVLQLVLPFGIGRFYTGHVGTGIAQLMLSFIGIGILWAWIDGIVILAGRTTDRYGRPLRP